MGNNYLEHYKNPFIQDAGNYGIYAALNGFKMLSEEIAKSGNFKDDIFKLVKKVSYFSNNDYEMTFSPEFFDADNLCCLIKYEIFKKSNSSEFYLIPTS